MNVKPRYINIKGQLLDISVPRVMGIINITPDSFYSGSRYQDEKSVVVAVGRMISDGASMIDIGGYSSRPGAGNILVEEERRRVMGALQSIIREFPDAIISVDTFRAAIAEEAVLDYGAALINDITGGEGDPEMFSTIEKLGVPYILMHMQGSPDTMQKNPVYDDVVPDIIRWFGERIVKLHSMGVKDIIIDPGFGFGKTIEHNFTILERLKDFSVTGLPILCGLSRKSMIWKTLSITPEEALNGTTILNTIALMKGCDILRVHDVKEAVEAVRLVGRIKT